ncbi:tail fiber domain-containing protein [Candidatus Dojkabacteria bacterium]|nr:tail fiber domain-containing protein [Candidatus Dojkabacteria bacterium]
MKKIFTLLTFLCCFSIINENIFAQLKVYAPNNNVGINATAPNSKLSVLGDGFPDSRVTFHNNSTSNNSKTLRLYTPLPAYTYIYGLFSHFPQGSSAGEVNIAVFASAYRGSTPLTSGQGVGVRAQAGNARSGFNVSMLAELLGSNNGAAICATTPGKPVPTFPSIYAGYFRGNVYIENDLNVNGVFTNSDINLKKDVVHLEGSNLAKIQQLQAIKYKMKNPLELNAFSKEATDTGKVSMTETELKDPLYTKDHIGISAQEIQKVYPEIVKMEDNGYLSVNYIALIPILIEAIKEQQVTIEELQKQMAALTRKTQ